MVFAGLFERLVGPLSDRPRQLVGALLGAAGAGHFAVWTQGSSFPAVVSAGDLAAALTQLATYGQHHPAYVVAFVLGLLVIIRPD